MMVVKHVRAVLTNGATVLADSIYDSGWDPGYDNCISGLIDKKFIGDPDLVGNAPYKCCAHNGCTYNGWFSIKF